MDDLLNDTEPVTVAVNPPAPLPAGLGIHQIASLVREIAVNMYPIEVILTKHGLTAEQYKTLETNEFFQKALNSAVLEWNSPQSTNKRLAMEAAIALEDALPNVAARMSKNDEPLSGVVEVAKLFAKMSGVGEDKTPQAPSEKFKIIINLGEDTINLEKQRAPLIKVEEVQPQPEGSSAEFSLSTIAGPRRE